MICRPRPSLYLLARSAPKSPTPGRRLENPAARFGICHPFVRSGKSICRPGTRPPRYMCYPRDPRFARFHLPRTEQPGTEEGCPDCPSPPPAPIASPEKDKNDAPCCGRREVRKPPAFAPGQDRWSQSEEHTSEL